MATTPEAGFINGPIPGMSLTTEPGNRPWENPPELVTVEDAIEYYTKRIIADTDSHEQVLEMLRTGLPVENAANILNKTSVMNGMHTLDVGILVLPVIEELIMTVADIYGERYITSTDDLIKGSTISAREAQSVVDELDKKPTEKTQAEEAKPKANGLMAKPTTVTGE
jgi:hypothetical protein